VRARAARAARWLGRVARRRRRVAELVARTGAAVLASPRAKGVFPEDHARYVGVTGLGGQARVKEYLSSTRPARVLVLGSRLGELTSFWDPAFVPADGFIQVDLEPGAVRAAYPDARVLEVRAEIRAFLRALLERATVRAPTAELAPLAPRPSSPRAHGGCVRGALPGGAARDRRASDAIVLTEAGQRNAFTWGIARCRAPGRYRVGTGWARWATPAAGARRRARRGRPAVALLGDGRC
jgi:acetolactate synthase-1/2/3 large subunit